MFLCFGGGSFEESRITALRIEGALIRIAAGNRTGDSSMAPAPPLYRHADINWPVRAPASFRRRRNTCSWALFCVLSIGPLLRGGVRRLMVLRDHPLPFFFTWLLFLPVRVLSIVSLKSFCMPLMVFAYVAVVDCLPFSPCLCTDLLHPLASILLHFLLAWHVLSSFS